jgi:hypothetical protein
MNPWIGWGLAVVAVVAGWLLYGWRGVLLAVTFTVFWLLLQFTRALRAMRQAGQSPIGRVGSAVMFNAKLRPGLQLLQVIQMTRSLGERLTPEGTEPERWRWTDDGGSSVTLELRGGKVVRWTLERPAPPDDQAVEAQATDGTASTTSAASSTADPAASADRSR